MRHTLTWAFVSQNAFGNGPPKLLTLNDMVCMVEIEPIEAGRVPCSARNRIIYSRVGSAHSMKAAKQPNLWTHTEAVAIPVRLIKNWKVFGREDVGKGPGQCAEIACTCTQRRDEFKCQRMRDW